MNWHRFGELTREDVGALAAASGVLVIPLGATEQHGPHLPTYTDSTIIERLAHAAADLVELPCPLVIAPILPFGSSDHHLPFGGTLSISTTTYLALLLDLGRSAVADGFSRVLYLNGHGGNHELAMLAARDLSLQYPIHAASGSWWTIAAAELADWSRDNPTGFTPGHAGALESSLALTLYPELVRELPSRSADAVSQQSSDRATRLRIDRHENLLRLAGYTDDPAAAAPTPDLLSGVVRAIARELEHFERTTRESVHA